MRILSRKELWLYWYMKLTEIKKEGSHQFSKGIVLQKYHQPRLKTVTTVLNLRQP